MDKKHTPVQPTRKASEEKPQPSEQTSQKNNGEPDPIVASYMRSYGITREEAEKEIDTWW